MGWYQRRVHGESSYISRILHKSAKEQYQPIVTMASAFKKFKQLENQNESPPQNKSSEERPARKKLQTYNHIVSKFETLDGDERKKIVQERLKQRQMEKEAKLEEERKRRQVEEEERLRKLREEEEDRIRQDELRRKLE